MVECLEAGAHRVAGKHNQNSSYDFDKDTLNDNIRLKSDNEKLKHYNKGIKRYALIVSVMFLASVMAVVYLIIR